MLADSTPYMCEMSLVRSLTPLVLLASFAGETTAARVGSCLSFVSVLPYFVLVRCLSSRARGGERETVVGVDCFDGVSIVVSFFELPRFILRPTATYLSRSLLAFVLDSAVAEWAAD